MKFRRIMSIVAISAIMLMGCGSETAEEASSTAVQTQVAEETQVVEESSEYEAPSFDEDDLAATINGVNVALGADINTLLDALGEPDDFASAASCTGEGDDKTYTYGNSYIYTEPKDGIDSVWLIEIEEGNETTAAGLGVGASYNDIVTAYGEDFTEADGAMSYALDNLTLSFYMDGETCTFIEIYGN